MRTFQSTGSEDFALGSDGNLTVISGLPASTQTARQYMRARAGEMFLNVDEGIPFDPVAWSGTPNLAQFESAGRTRLLQMPEVVEVLSFVARQDGDTLSYTAEILTESGEATVNG